MILHRIVSSSGIVLLGLGRQCKLVGFVVLCIRDTDLQEIATWREEVREEQCGRQYQMTLVVFRHKLLSID